MLNSIEKWTKCSSEEGNLVDEIVYIIYIKRDKRSIIVLPLFQAAYNIHIR